MTKINTACSFIIIILLVVFKAEAQHYEKHHLALLLKQYKLAELEHELENAKPSLSREIVTYELNYLKEGINKPISKTIFESYNNVSHIDSVFFYNYKGDVLSRKIKPNDSLGFKYYLKALNVAKRKSDTLLINASLERINRFFIKNFKDKDLYKKYVKDLKNYVQDEVDVFWNSYYTLVYEMTFSSFSKPEFESLENQFLDLHKNTKMHSYFEGIVKHMIGIFYSYPQDNKSSKYYFNEALKTYNDTMYYSISRKVRTQIALAIAHYDDREFQTAIKELNKSVNNRFVKQDFELQLILFDWLQKSYEQINKIDSSQYYLKQKIIAKDSLQHYAFASRIREIDTQYEVQQKDEKIDDLQTTNMELKTKILTIIPFVFGILVIMFILIYLYRRYKKKSTVLEEEKSQTLLKLEELKNIVVKNHITLKDKTKVYVSDLIYVKSDDHYLEIITQDNKKHTVRGKLSQIKEELPPNFIQCHRSYIVNSNFIKQVNSNTLVLINKEQIPLSRSYKKKF